MRCMQNIKLHLCLLLAMLLVAAAAGAAQSPSSSEADQTPKKNVEPPEKPTKKKLVLSDATRVSTDTAVGDAAKQASKKPEDAKQQPTTEAVVEFHPAEAQVTASPGVKTEAQKSRKKDIHGTVFGAADAKNSGTHRAGGAVGATSKGGKTSVYVETERDRTTSPH